MKLPSAEVLASWPAPNYINPETRGDALIILNSVCLGLMTIILILRLYTRLVVKRWFGWDDFFIICAFISTVLLNTAVDLGIIRYGWRRHAWDIPLSMAKPAYKMAYLAKLPFLFAGFFTASSLLAFYYRLIAESGVKWFRIALHCSVAFNILAWLPFVFAELFICVPIHAYWSFPEPPGSRCLHEAPVTMAGGYVKIFVDLLITTLPIPLIMRMNMQRRQRYLVVMLLSLGYIVAIAGAIRTYYTWKALYGTNDPTWYQYPAFIASAIENNLAIMCACVPTIRPLFPHLFGGPVSRIQNWMSSYQTSKADQSGGSYGSQISRDQSKVGNSTNMPAAIVPAKSSSGASETKLVIRQTESFELTENSVHDDPSGPVERPDYYHFGPRHERTGFHAV